MSEQGRAGTRTYNRGPAAKPSNALADGGFAKRPVPWKTIVATIACVLITAAALLLLQKMTKVITWVVIAGFFAVVLNPAVDFLTHRAHLRRTLATLIVFLLGIGLFAAMLYAFIHPLVDQASKFANDFPTYVTKARNGEGTIGHLVKKYKLDDYVDRNQSRFREQLSSAGAPAAKVASGIANTVAALVTILVLTFLLLLEAPKLTAGVQKLIPPKQRDRVRLVAGDSAKAVTGYMGGNVLISIIAGVATYAFLKIIDVPFAEVLALWVAFADLIPLVGATLGAIATVGVAFLSSPTDGIAAIVFYVIYQQFENHVLQVSIMSRTVKLNPLAVLLSVLVGVELFGILGALLAIPAAGVIQVICRDIYDNDLGMLKEEPTIGAEEVAVADELRERGDVPAETKQAVALAIARSEGDDWPSADPGREAAGSDAEPEPAANALGGFSGKGGA